MYVCIKIYIFIHFYIFSYIFIYFLYIFTSMPWVPSISLPPLYNTSSGYLLSGPGLGGRPVVPCIPPRVFKRKGQAFRCGFCSVPL